MDYYGLLLFFVLEYVRPTSYLPFLNILHLNALVPLLVIFQSLNKNRHIGNIAAINTFNIRILLFFLFLIVVSVFTADVTFYAYKKFTSSLSYLLITFVMIKILSERQKLNGLIFTLAFSHLIIIFLNPQIITDPDTRHYLASGSFLGDGNDFSLSVNIVVPLTIYLFLIADRMHKRIIYGITIILLILGIIGTSSRGGTLALISLFLYFWWISPKKTYGIIAMTIITGIVFAFAPPNYFQRMNTLPNYESDGSAMGRIVAWKAAVRMVADHPFIGVGAGHFPVKFGVEYRPQEYGIYQIPWLTAHSQYFLALGELGFPGMIFLLIFIIGNLRRNNRLIKDLGESENEEKHNDKKLLICLNSSLVAYSVGGAFLSSLYYPHIFVLAGLHESARLIIQKKRGNENLKDQLWQNNSVPSPVIKASSGEMES